MKMEKYKLKVGLIRMVKELIEVQNDKLAISGFESKENGAIMTWICTTGPS